MAGLYLAQNLKTHVDVLKEIKTAIAELRKTGTFAACSENPTTRQYATLKKKQRSHGSESECHNEHLNSF